MGFESVLKSENGINTISFILGLGLAALFRKVCNDDNCLIIEGPPLKDVENKIFQQEDKCYRYTPKSSKCSK